MGLNRDHEALTLDQAIEEPSVAADSALRLDPRSSIAHRIRGDIESVRPLPGDAGDAAFDSARAAYLQAIELEPANGEALGRLGRMLFRRRAFVEAAPLLERAVDLDPSDMTLRMDYARAIRVLGHIDQTRQHYLEILGIDPQHEAALVSLGYLERQVGRLDASAYWFERAAAATGDWNNHVRLAVTYTDLGDLDRMRGAADAIGGSPFEDALREAMKAMLESRFEDLIAVAEAQLGKSDDELWRDFAATAAVVVGDYDRALGHYTVTAPDLFKEDPEIGPGHAIDALWVAFALSEKGDLAHATRLAEGVLTLLAPPEHGYDWVYNKVYRMAAYAILGRDDDGLREFRAAIDQGSRTILYRRVVPYEDAPMLRTLRHRPEFKAMIAEIKGYNALMLADLEVADQRRTKRRPA